MTDEEVLAEFRAADALLEGHFILSSGLRSPRYLQCARVLMSPGRAARLTDELACRIPEQIRSQLDAVVSPAMGGVIAGHEMGRALGLDAMFVERPTGIFELRRGFALVPGAKVLMPVSIERGVWEYFSGKAEQRGVGLSELVTEVLKRDIELNQTLR